MWLCKSRLIWAERWLCYWRQMKDPHGCVLGILCLISEEGDGYSPSTDTLKRLSANYQVIHLSDSLSHYFFLFRFPTSSPEHLHSSNPSSFSSPSSSLTSSLLPSPLFFFFPFTNPCLFPVYNLLHTVPWAEMHARNGDKKVMIQPRLCWQSFLPACRIQSICFRLGEREDRGY